MPGETDSQWEHDLQQAVSLDAEHLRHLTYEKNTRIYQMLKARRIREVDGESSTRFFAMLTDKLRRGRIRTLRDIQLLPNPACTHATTPPAQGVPYLGCGPSAHSFDLSHTREWNIASLNPLHHPLHGERATCHLKPSVWTYPRYNEYVMTSLRTMWGISLEEVSKKFGTELATLHRHRRSLSEKRQAGNGRPTAAPRHEASPFHDGIISDLMFV